MIFVFINRNENSERNTALNTITHQKVNIISLLVLLTIQNLKVHYLHCPQLVFFKLNTIEILIKSFIHSFIHSFKPLPTYNTYITYDTIRTLLTSFNYLQYGTLFTI